MEMVKLIVRILSTLAIIAVYLFLWLSAHFIRTDPCFREGVNEFIIAAACVFDVFNIFMLIVAVIWLVIWAWS